MLLAWKLLIERPINNLITKKFTTAQLTEVQQTTNYNMVTLGVWIKGPFDTHFPIAVDMFQ